MMKTMKTVFGKCPQIDGEKNIEIEFVKHNPYSTECSIGRFECDKASLGQCEHYKRNNSCPIYNNFRELYNNSKQPTI